MIGNMRINTRANAPFFVVALPFLFTGVLCNEWLLTMLFSGDGELVDRTRLIIWVTSIISIGTGLFIMFGRPKTMVKPLLLLYGNMAVFFCGVLIIELIFGNWIFEDKLNKLYINRNVTIKTYLEDLYPSNRTVVIETRDKDGFRGWYSDVSDIDILAVGGSTTRQRYVNDDETWTHVLHSVFEEHGQEVSVVNAGISGQSSYGHVKNFDLWFPAIPNLKVKYFLFYIGVNEIFNDANDELDDLEGNQLGLVTNLVRTRSALFHLFRTLHGMYRASFIYDLNTSRKTPFSDYQWTDKPLVSDHNALMKSRLEGYEKRLRRLCEEVKKLGSTPIFVTQTTRRYKLENGTVYGVVDAYQYDGVSWNGVDHYYMMELINKKTLEVCAEYGGIPVDLANELRFDLENDFYDYVHNTQVGSKKIGHYLYEKLNHLFSEVDHGKTISSHKERNEFHERANAGRRAALEAY